jgi:hypothetical protein
VLDFFKLPGWYKEIMKQKKWSLSRQLQCLISSSYQAPRKRLGRREGGLFLSSFSARFLQVTRLLWRDYEAEKVVFVSPASVLEFFKLQGWCLLNEIMKEKQWSLSRQLQCLISSSHLLGLVHHHLHCWTLAITIQMTRLQFKRKRFHASLTSNAHLQSYYRHLRSKKSSSSRYWINEHKNRNHNTLLCSSHSLRHRHCLHLFSSYKYIRIGLKSRPNICFPLLLTPVNTSTLVFCTMTSSASTDR